jgi:RHS repeat-associated protein
VTYPDTVNPSLAPLGQNPYIAGPTYNYSYDSMYRLSGMTDSNNNTIVSNVSYNAANRLLTMNYPGASEVRGYNVLNQLTTLSAGSENLTYNYPTGTNNGKVSSMYNAVSGETITYAYDSLNRLLTASGTGGGATWGQQYGYDPFGNLLSKTITAGSGPSLSVSVNPASNQIQGVSGLSYDADGNQNVGTYDAENRLSSAQGLTYAYDGQNERIWSWNGGTDGSNNPTGYSVVMYSPTGQKLATYQLTPQWLQGWSPAMWMQVTLSASDQYFGGRRLAVVDRLGSVGTYFPWGEDKGSTNPQNTWSYATYWRDSGTNLDYANNRYYSNAYGRFMTPDPSRSSNATVIPQNWNRYAYVGGDPVNKNDPMGLCSPEDDPPCYSVTGTGTSPGSVGSLDDSWWDTGTFGGTILDSYYTSQITSASQGIMQMVANANANTQKVDATLAQLRNALSNDSNCLNFLESGIAGNSTSVFNQYFNALDGANGQAPLATALDFSLLPANYQGLNGLTGGIGGGGILINSNGAFFSSAVGVGYANVYANQVQGMTGGTPQAQFFILLHELSHFFQAQGFIQNDTALGAQKANNDLLWKDCSKTIQSAGGGGLI